MRGTKAWNWLCASSRGFVALLAILFVGSATASSSSATQLVATYGTTRAWGGTQIRSLDPVPSLPSRSGASSSTQSGAPRASAASVAADQALSNEFSLTQWAYVARRARVYASPTAFAH